MAIRIRWKCTYNQLNIKKNYYTIQFSCCCFQFLHDVRSRQMGRPCMQCVYILNSVSVLQEKKARVNCFVTFTFRKKKTFHCSSKTLAVQCRCNPANAWSLRLFIFYDFLHDRVQLETSFSTRNCFHLICLVFIRSMNFRKQLDPQIMLSRPFFVYCLYCIRKFNLFIFHNFDSKCSSAFRR